MNAVAALRGQLVDYRELLALRDFRLLWAAQVVSSFGDRLSQIALAALVYAITGSELGIGLVLTITVLPRAVFGFLAGLVADRISRKTLLIATDCARAGIVILLALAGGLPVAWVYLLTAVHATAAVFFTPTRYAVLPDIVPNRSLLTANTFDETTQNALDPLAFLAGGAIVAALGARLAFAADSVTFLASALLIALTTARGASQWHARAGGAPAAGCGEAPGSAGTAATVTAEPGGEQVGDPGRLAADLAAGVAALWRHPTLRANTLLMLFAAAVASAEMPLTYMMVFTHWQTGALGLGIFEAVLALGFVAGALLCRPLVARVGNGPAILIGLVGTGALMVAVAVLPFWAAVLCNGVSGIFNIFFFVPTLTLHQELAPAAVRARVLGSRAALMAAALALSYGLATALTTVFEPAPILFVMGAVLAAGAAVACAWPVLRAR